jgi:hypothetical protein
LTSRRRFPTRRAACPAVTIVKQTQRFDASAASALLRMAVPARAGLYLRPPPITEVLTTNLLPIVELPPVIFAAPASARTYIEAGEILDVGKRPAFLLRDGLVASFASLREPPLSELCDGDVEEFDTTEWANGDEADVQHRFIDLISRTVENSYPDLRWHNARRHVHFRATSDLSPRKAGRGPGSRGRTVFGPHYAKSDPERISYYHHAALGTRYRRIAGTWYCQLEPGYCFTIDGHTEASFADSLLAGIKRLDKHPAVKGWTRMWANHLNKQPDLDTLDRPVLFGPLETVTVDRGIDDRWWGPAPTEVHRPGRRKGHPLDVLAPLDRDVPARLHLPRRRRCPSAPARHRLRPGHRTPPGHRSGAAAAPARHRHPTAPPRPGSPAALVDLATPPPAPRPPRPPALERLRRDNTMITTNYWLP